MKHFVNYFVEMLRMKLFQEDFGKTVVKLTVNYKRNQYFLQHSAVE